MCVSVCLNFLFFFVSFLVLDGPQGGPGFVRFRVSIGSWLFITAAGFYSVLENIGRLEIPVRANRL